MRASTTKNPAYCTQKLSCGITLFSFNTKIVDPLRFRSWLFTIQLSLLFLSPTYHDHQSTCTKHHVFFVFEVLRPRWSLYKLLVGKSAIDLHHPPSIGSVIYVHHGFSFPRYREGFVLCWHDETRSNFGPTNGYCPLSYCTGSPTKTMLTGQHRGLKAEP